MHRFTKVSIAFGVALLAAVPSAQAQSANIQALANVFQAMTVSGVRNLDFGNVFPGVNKSIAVDNANSGKFTVAGQASANVNLTFTLPANLTSGGNNLPIGTWVGHWNGVDDASSGTNFTPSAGATAAQFSGSGNLYVFVGATVSPGGSQTAGSYSGTVTMTVAYF